MAIRFNQGGDAMTRYEDVFKLMDGDIPVPSGFCAIPEENRGQVLAEIVSTSETGKVVKSDDDSKRTAGISL